MTRPWLARRWVSIVVAASAFALVASLAGAFDPSHAVGDSLGLRRFVTPEIAGRWRVGERFVMNARDLAAIDVRGVTRGTAGGTLRFELRAEDRGGALVRSGAASAAEVARQTSYRFAFAPIPDSRDRRYRFEVFSSSDAPSHGVALRATRGDRLRGAALLINGVERWGDLAFTASAAQPARSGASGVLRPLVMVGLAGLAMAFTAMTFLLRDMDRDRA